jgi:hypothetical protein
VLLSLAAVEDQDERLASTADNLQQQQQQHQQQVQPMLFAFEKQSPHDMVQQCWSCKHLLLAKWKTSWLPGAGVPAVNQQA